MALILEDMSITFSIGDAYTPGTAPSWTGAATYSYLGVARSIEISDEFDSVNAGGATGIKRRYFNRNQMIRVRGVVTYNANNVLNLPQAKSLTTYTLGLYNIKITVKNNSTLTPSRSFEGVMRRMSMSTDQGNPQIEEMEIDLMADWGSYSASQGA
jgi:hypothetical protein